MTEVDHIVKMENSNRADFAKAAGYEEKFKKAVFAFWLKTYRRKL